LHTGYHGRDDFAGFAISCRLAGCTPERGMNRSSLKKKEICQNQVPGMAQMLPIVIGDLRLGLKSSLQHKVLASTKDLPYL
jgi:hypothetical protein